MPNPVFMLTLPAASRFGQSAATLLASLRRFIGPRALLLLALPATQLLPSTGWAGSLSEHAASQRPSSSSAKLVQPVADYAAWSGHNQDGSWTRAAEYAVGNSELPKLQPADIQQFCPQYRRLPHQQRKQFWVGLLSAMSGPESNFRPASFYQERFHDRKGKPVVSRGLLQISQESANQQRYGCDIRHPALLHDPVINLACGVRILSLWVKRDQLIASPAGSAPKGGGRYWSTLRHSNGKTAQISDFTRSLPVCQGKTSQQRTAKQVAPQRTSQQLNNTSPAVATRYRTDNSLQDDRHNRDSRDNSKHARNNISNKSGHQKQLTRTQVTPAPLHLSQRANSNADRNVKASISARAQTSTNASANSSTNSKQHGGYIRLTGGKTPQAGRKLPR